MGSSMGKESSYLRTAMSIQANSTTAGLKAKEFTCGIRAEQFTRESSRTDLGMARVYGLNVEIPTKASFRTTKRMDMGT